jgi:hypothetical protein
MNADELASAIATLTKCVRQIEQLRGAGVTSSSLIEAAIESIIEQIGAVYDRESTEYARVFYPVKDFESYRKRVLGQRESYEELSQTMVNLKVALQDEIIRLETNRSKLTKPAASDRPSDRAAPDTNPVARQAQADILGRLDALEAELERARPLLEQFEAQQRMRSRIGDNRPPEPLPFDTAKLNLALAADRSLRVQLSAKGPPESNALRVAIMVFEQARDGIADLRQWIADNRDEIGAGLLVTALAAAISELPLLFQGIIDLLQTWH